MDEILVSKKTSSVFDEFGLSENSMDVLKEEPARVYKAAIEIAKMTKLGVPKGFDLRGFIKCIKLYN